MRNFSNFKKYVMTGALSLGVIGAAAIPAFAETNVDKVAEDSSKTIITEINIDKDSHKAPLVLKFNWGQDVDEATKKKTQEILEETKAKLEELGVTWQGKFMIGHPFANLDENTKEKVRAIMEKVKSGELSRTEAQNQLEELGIDLPMHGGFVKQGIFHMIRDELKENSLDQSNHAILKKVGLGIVFKNLDEATKEEVLKIMEKLKNGELSRTEAKQQLEELGANLQI